MFVGLSPRYFHSNQMQKESLSVTTRWQQKTALFFFLTGTESDIWKEIRTIIV